MKKDLTTLVLESPIDSEVDLFIEVQKNRIEKRLFQLVDTVHPPSLQEASRYAISSGKRLRPLLLLLVVDACGGNLEAAIDPAAALEMIHVFSLIHDDLPSVDNDDLRRGKPTVHKQFTEWQALLAGDFFLNFAFEVLSKAPLLNDSQKIALIQTIATFTGHMGMIGGQCLDIEMKGKACSVSQITVMHEKKTSALFQAAATCGAIISNLSALEITHVKNFGTSIGLAYQMFDDIQDATQDRLEANITHSIGLIDARNKVQDYLKQAFLELSAFSISSYKLQNFFRKVFCSPTN